VLFLNKAIIVKRILPAKYRILHSSQALAFH
jgi:hypothetical protein